MKNRRRRLKPRIKRAFSNVRVLSDIPVSPGECISWIPAALGVELTALLLVAARAPKPLGNAPFSLSTVGAIIALSSLLIVLFLRSRNRVRRHLLGSRVLLVRLR